MTLTVSVLTPTIPGRDWYLTRAKFSVLWQTRSHIRHVIVNGENLSPAQAFQQALDQADSDLVIPLADDDWLAPHAIQTLADILQANPGVDWVAAQTLITRTDGTSSIVGHQPDLRHMQVNGYDLGGAHMWRKTLTDRIGGFNPHYPNTADYDLYWRMLESHCGIAYHPEPLYHYTDHPNTDGNTNGPAILEQCATIRKAHLA